MTQAEKIAHHDSKRTGDGVSTISFSDRHFVRKKAESIVLAARLLGGYAQRFQPTEARPERAMPMLHALLSFQQTGGRNPPQ
jgi:hypothetical protein